MNKDNKTVEKELINFAQWVWGLSPHNFNNGKAPKFQSALKDFIKFKFKPILRQARKEGREETIAEKLAEIKKYSAKLPIEIETTNSLYRQGMHAGLDLAIDKLLKND